MTIVIERHPVLSAVVASTIVAMFVAVSIWLAVYPLRNLRSKKKPIDIRGGIVGGAGTVFWLVFAAWWWHGWSPWAVEVTGNVIELNYLLSTQRIELAELERVEFELVRPGRRRERSIVRLSSGGRVYRVTQDPEPSGGLATRPVRQVFDQLATRLPSQKVCDVTKHE